LYTLPSVFPHPLGLFRTAATAALVGRSGGVGWGMGALGGPTAGPPPVSVGDGETLMGALDGPTAGPPPRGGGVGWGRWTAQRQGRPPAAAAWDGGVGRSNGRAAPRVGGRWGNIDGGVGRPNGRAAPRVGGRWKYWWGRWTAPRQGRPPTIQTSDRPTFRSRGVGWSDGFYVLLGYTLFIYHVASSIPVFYILAPHILSVYILASHTPALPIQ
jgi:hypothetical protein